MRLAPISLGIIAMFGMIAAATGCHSSAPAPATFSPLDQADKYQWLEDVSSERSLAWVKAQNARTTRVLESDPRFAGLQESALMVYESPDHLAIPVLREGMVYNTWQDAQHVRGILRRTTLADYLTAQPHWQTVIDYDALAKQDKQEWVANGKPNCHVRVFVSCSARYWCTKATAILPSPTPLDTRLMELWRTSPAQKTPGRLVSRGNGARGCFQVVRSRPVQM